MAECGDVVYCRLAYRSDPRSLTVDGIETFALYDAVFEIDADNPEVQEALDVLTKLTVVFGISTLEIQTDGDIDAGYDPAHDLLGQRFGNFRAARVGLSKPRRHMAKSLLTGGDRTDPTRAYHASHSSRARRSSRDR